MNVRRTTASGLLVASSLLALPLVTAPAASAAPPTCFGQVATIRGTNGPDHIVGTPLADVVVLKGGKDSFIGAGGDDLVCGGSGKDILDGGEGNDRLDGGSGADQLRGGNGDDTLRGGDGKDALEGSEGDDRLLGGPDNDYVREGAGNDTIRGGTGVDYLTYLFWSRGIRLDLTGGTVDGAGRDSVGGMEIFQATRFADVLRGSSGPDDMRGVSGNDTIRGLGGDDALSDSEGRIFGGSGKDFAVITNTAVAFMGSGTDSVALGNGTPRASGGADGDFFAVATRKGKATIDAGPGDNQISFGTLGREVSLNVGKGSATWKRGRVDFTDVHNFIGSKRDDVLVGSSGLDFLFGVGGDDVLRGLGGNDFLDGGHSHSDRVFGGDGYDVCRGETTRGCEA